MDDVVATILRFLEEIGIAARPSHADHRGVVPGVHVVNGAIEFNPEAMLYPGDLLHEAAHIAFTPSAERSSLSGRLDTGPGDEMAAIAWSYAAALHLGIDPAIVFHGGGYRGGSSALLENFRGGSYVGVPLLQWAGMTTEPKRGVDPSGAFPHMTKWLRD